MASDVEDLTGVTLTATVAFRHPTIESLATVIIEGEPETQPTTPSTGGLDAPARRSGDRDRRHCHPLPRRHEHPR